MKKIIATLIVLTLSIGSIGIPAYADSSNDPASEPKVDNVAQTRIVHSYKKTIDHYFDRSVPFSQLPASIDYTEYNDDLHTWFSGTLYVDSIVTHGDFWKVTYKGYLVGLL